MKLPKKCKLCEHVGAYKSGPFSKNPHYCCELIWELTHEDYKVDPETIDPKCPLKDSRIISFKEDWSK